MEPPNSVFEESNSGWGGRIRTSECVVQSHVPYHLATPQRLSANTSSHPWRHG